jgi:hypothetical protein
MHDKAQMLELLIMPLRCIATGTNAESGMKETRTARCLGRPSATHFCSPRLAAVANWLATHTTMLLDNIQLFHKHRPFSSQ